MEPPWNRRKWFHTANVPLIRSWGHNAKILQFSLSYLNGRTNNHKTICWYSHLSKFEFSNVIIGISKHFETKDGIFVKIARQVPPMGGNFWGPKKTVPLNESSFYQGFHLSEQINRGLLRQIQGTGKNGLELYEKFHLSRCNCIYIYISKAKTAIFTHDVCDIFIVKMAGSSAKTQQVIPCRKITVTIK